MVGAVRRRARIIRRLFRLIDCRRFLRRVTKLFVAANFANWADLVIYLDPTECIVAVKKGRQNP